MVKASHNVSLITFTLKGSVVQNVPRPKFTSTMLDKKIENRHGVNEDKLTCGAHSRTYGGIYA